MTKNTKNPLSSFFSFFTKQQVLLPLLGSSIIAASGILLSKWLASKKVPAIVNPEVQAKLEQLHELYTKMQLTVSDEAYYVGTTIQTEMPKLIREILVLDPTCKEAIYFDMYFNLFKGPEYQAISETAVDEQVFNSKCKAWDAGDYLFIKLLFKVQREGVADITDLLTELSKLCKNKTQHVEARVRYMEYTLAFKGDEALVKQYYQDVVSSRRATKYQKARAHFVMALRVPNTSAAARMDLLNKALREYPNHFQALYLKYKGLLSESRLLEASVIQQELKRLHPSFNK